MIIIKTKNYEELSKKAADIIGSLVVFGLVIVSLLMFTIWKKDSKKTNK